MSKEKRYKVAVRSGDGKELGEVSVSVARPKHYRQAVILGHGAGNNMDNALLVYMQDYLVDRSIAAIRFNFLYTEKGKRAPDRRPLLEACWRSVADWTRSELDPEKLFLSGKSMGGRMASYIVADGYACNGLFFLGYPLHPPGKTEQLRKDQLPRIKVPLLFVAGTRDSLSKLELLEPVVRELGSKATLHLIEGGDHSFRVPKRTGKTADDIQREIGQVVVRWLESI
jgi:predicted alpha/beta-hydrolase family hydrolase